MAADLLGAVVLVMMTLAFYRLFKSVDQHLAVLVVILGGVMPALLYLVNVASDATTLMLVRGSESLSVFDKPQREALAMLFLRHREHQTTAAEILWGAWLFPLGGLVCKSTFLPRFLGVWLWGNGAAYVVLSLTGVLWPQYQEKVFAYGQPLFFAEIVVMLWLVIKGGIPRAQPSLAS